MNDSNQDPFVEDGSKGSKVALSDQEASQRKGPLSFLSGAITSALFAWLCFSLSQKTVTYFTLHSPHYSSAIAQSVASGFKTLVIGICFLATFTFGFIGLGLFLVFIRSLFDGKSVDTD